VGATAATQQRRSDDVVVLSSRKSKTTINPPVSGIAEEVAYASRGWRCHRRTIDAAHGGSGSKANRNLCAALRHYQQGGMVRQGCAGKEKSHNQPPARSDR